MHFNTLISASLIPLSDISVFQQLDKLPLEQHDLSQTILPEGYMKQRLLRAMAYGHQDEAKALLNTNYAGLKNPRMH